MKEDRIYALPLDQVGSFEFDEQVVRVFPDMIQRSVPGYASILTMTAELAERYAQPATNVYDLGCSLGAAALLLRKRIPATCVVHAIDSSAAMVRRLRTLVAADDGWATIQVCEADLRSIAVEQASFAVLNFTLQFVSPHERPATLQNVYNGLVPGGALVLSEKVRFDDAGRQTLMTDLHHAFKRANGYSELEIAQKRTALEDTLIAETIETHLQRLDEVGFSQALLWFQCFQFVSILAIK